MSSAPEPGSTSPGAPARWRVLALAAGPALFAIALAVPMPGATPQAHRLAAIFLWTVVYWATEALPLPVTALLASALAILLGVAPAPAILAPYADPVIFVFIGSFVLAAAMGSSGLDRRFALGVLSRPWATATPARLLATVGIVTCAISLWVSNTATTAMMLPIALGILRSIGPLGDTAISRYPVGVLLMLTWASSVAVGVPVGSPPNLIAIGLVRDLTGRHITFVDWMAVAMPATVAMLAVCWGLARLLYREPPGHRVALAPVAVAQAPRGPWTLAERCVAGVFVVTVALWMAPGVAAALAPGSAAARWLDARVPESVVALAAAVAVFALPTGILDGPQRKDWTRLATIDWGTILLFGGGLSLGRAMFDTGLAAWAGRAVVDLVGAHSLWAITAVAIVVGVILSEACSNTASASMLVPVMIAVAESAGVSAVPPALGAALGASFGFMLPVSTPPNAIVYGSGLVRLADMMRAGALLDVIGIAVIWATLRLLCPLVGLA